MRPSFCKNLGPISIDKIKSLIKCKTLNLSLNEKFTDLVSLENPSNESITFLYDDEVYNDNLSLDSVLICSKQRKNAINPKQKALIVDDVQEAVAKISNIFYRDFNTNEINDFKEPIIGQDCTIGKNVTIENGVKIGNKVLINHGAIIGVNCVIGDGCRIGSNTVISNTVIGNKVEIGNNSSIGQPGFGFYLSKNNNLNIYHSGIVILQNKVKIGSACTIDRGSFSDTIVGENTYLDNLCHIAHNVKIGNNSAFAAMTGVAGSAKIGNNVLTGGQTGIAGHIVVGDNVQVAAKSGVFKSLSNGEKVMGNPAIKMLKFIKIYKKIYGK